MEEMGIWQEEQNVLIIVMKLMKILWDCDEALDAIADKMLSNISKCNYCGQDYHEECDEALYETVDRMLEEERKKVQKSKRNRKKKRMLQYVWLPKESTKGFNSLIVPKPDATLSHIKPMKRLRRLKLEV